jgi:hypothetical protein
MSDGVLVIFLNIRLEGIKANKFRTLEGAYTLSETWTDSTTWAYVKISTAQGRLE